MNKKDECKALSELTPHEQNLVEKAIPIFMSSYGDKTVVYVHNFKDLVKLAKQWRYPLYMDKMGAKFYYIFTPHYIFYSKLG